MTDIDNSPAPPATVKTTSTKLTAAVAGIVTVPLVVVFALVVAAAGFGWWIGPFLLGLIVGVGFVWWLQHRAAERLLTSLGAVPAAASSGHDRIINLVEGLSLAAGIPAPDVRIVHDSCFNAAAVGNDDHSYVVATTGLIEGLSRIELEGVVAELIARIGSGDAAVATTACALARPLELLGAHRAVSWLKRQVFVESRVVLCDLSAVSLTRYPPGLRAALGAIRNERHIVAGAPKGYEPVWIVSTDPNSPRSAVSDGTVDLDFRIELLTEL